MKNFRLAGTCSPAPTPTYPPTCLVDGRPLSCSRMWPPVSWLCIARRSTDIATTTPGRPDGRYGMANSGVLRGGNILYYFLYVQAFNLSFLSVIFILPPFDKRNSNINIPSISIFFITSIFSRWHKHIINIFFLFAISLHFSLTYLCLFNSAYNSSRF